jgi:hypothetical protein
VADIILTASSTELLRRTVSALQWEFAMKNLGPLHHFLSITVERHPDGLFFHQCTYTLDVIQRVAMADCKPCTTPVDIQVKLVTLWASGIGHLLVPEHHRSSPVPDVYSTRHHLSCASDLFAHV